MKNALIDDRRIHVDFSQSVAKLWSQYRRKSQGQGGGCFKCSSLTGDHSAYKSSKYTLKYDLNVRGGDGNTRYEMVFEEDAHGSPKHSKHRGGCHKAGQPDDKRIEIPNDVIIMTPRLGMIGRSGMTEIRNTTNMYNAEQVCMGEEREITQRYMTGVIEGKPVTESTGVGQRRENTKEDIFMMVIIQIKGIEKKRDERNGSDTKKRSVNGDIHRDRDIKDDSDGFKRRRGDERHSNNASYKSDVRYRDDDHSRRH